jgi:DNA-binding response OmpR family regulator
MAGADRVLVIEDDASIRRFIELALEEEPIELVQAESVAQGLAALRGRGPFRLVMTDLMLPDGSGQQLLQALQGDAALRAGARVAVFSAGLSAETRQQLAGLGVDEVIAKPAGVAQLLTCVQRALDAGPAEAPVPTADPEALAVDLYFAGNRPLYETYRDSCRQQFALDRQAGDAAVQAADWQALRRLAHSLKSVLQTLGHDADGATARTLEADTDAGRHEAARAGWQRLGAALDRLAP